MFPYLSAKHDFPLKSHADSILSHFFLEFSPANIKHEVIVVNMLVPLV